MERNGIEMNFFFEWEFDAKVDGLNGKFTGSEIINLNEYEEVDGMIELTKKIMMKKQNGEITFRCVKFKPEYDSQPMIRLCTSVFTNGRIIRWNEGQSYGDDEAIESWNAKMLKEIVLEAMKEYRHREFVEEWKQKEREDERQTA